MFNSNYTGFICDTILGKNFMELKLLNSFVSMHFLNKSSKFYNEYIYKDWDLIDFNSPKFI